MSETKLSNSDLGVWSSISASANSIYLSAFGAVAAFGYSERQLVDDAFRHSTNIVRLSDARTNILRRVSEVAERKLNEDGTRHNLLATAFGNLLNSDSFLLLDEIDSSIVNVLYSFGVLVAIPNNIPGVTGDNLIVSSVAPIDQRASLSTCFGGVTEINFDAQLNMVDVKGWQELELVMSKSGVTIGLHPNCPYRPFGVNRFENLSFNHVPLMGYLSRHKINHCFGNTALILYTYVLMDPTSMDVIIPYWWYDETFLIRVASLARRQPGVSRNVGTSLRRSVAVELGHDGDGSGHMFNMCLLHTLGIVNYHRWEHGLLMNLNRPKRRSAITAAYALAFTNFLLAETASWTHEVFHTKIEYYIGYVAYTRLLPEGVEPLSTPFLQSIAF
jgi:hypothetical protein